MNRSSLQDKRSFYKSVGAVGIVTAISRILGLIREMVLAAFLGTSFYSDAFTLAFTFPNLFRRLTAEGAMANVFIPVFGEVRKREGDKRALDFARNFFWLSSLIMMCFSLILIALAPWFIKHFLAIGFTDEPLHLTVFLTRLMMFYIALISLASVFQGVLNSFSVFWVSSFTPVLLNICIIVFGILLSSHLANPTLGFAVGVLAGGVLQFAFQAPFVKKIGLNLFSNISFKDPYLKKAGWLMAPTIFGAGVYQINIIVSNTIASTLDEGAISSLKFSNRLLELVLGVFVVSMTSVILPRLSVLFLEEKQNEISRNLKDSIRLIAFVTLPATAGILVISEEIVTLLFARGAFGAESIGLTSGALRFHIIGLVFISWNRILLTCYQAAKYIKRTVHIATVIMIINLVGALCFSRYIGHLGIALASTISQIFQTALLVFFLRELCVKNVFSKSIGKTLIISFVSAVSVWFFKKYLIPEDVTVFLKVIIFIGIGITGFVLPAMLLKSREFYDLIRFVTNRK